MDKQKNTAFCTECRKLVCYKTANTTELRVVHGNKYFFDETIALCKECGATLFVDDIVDGNERRFDNLVRKAENIITIDEIKEILKHCNIDTVTLSETLGFGKSTITNYLEGKYPTKKNSDRLKKYAITAFDKLS